LSGSLLWEEGTSEWKEARGGKKEKRRKLSVHVTACPCERKEREVKGWEKKKEDLVSFDFSHLTAH